MTFVKRESLRNSAPLWKYLAISLSNVGATWCQYEALKFVAFPVQMLGKSFKMMPVMIWGIVISQKRYKVHSTTKYNQMLYVNSFSSMVSLITLLASRKAGEAFGFCGQHPRLIGDAIALSASAVAGQ